MNKSKINMEFARKYGILIVLIVMWVLLMAVSPTFRTATNAVNILRQVAVNGIIAIGMTFVIMTGGIDLTVGSLVAVAGVVSGSILVANPDNVVLAVAAGILVCALFGAMNGFFAAYMGVPPFVATLAGQTIARGFAYVYSDGKPYTLASDGFSMIGKGMAPIIIFIVILAICHIMLSKMKFGRYIYAVGGNPKAAEASGVRGKVHFDEGVYPEWSTGGNCGELSWLPEPIRDSRQSERVMRRMLSRRR